MAQSCSNIEWIVDHNRPNKRLSQLLIILGMALILVACGPSVSSTSATPAPDIIDVGNIGIAIERTLQDSQFSDTYGGRYFVNGRNIILVAGDPQPVAAFLIDHGFPASAFEVRRAETSLERLQQAEAAATRWLMQFPGGWLIGIDEGENKVLINVEREPLVDLLGYDPGDGPIPYEQWPESLKTALRDYVPGVRAELYSGFTIRPD